MGDMLLRSSRGRPLNAPAAFIHPCQPIVAKQPPSGPGWAHELKHDGYRLQIHVRDGRVPLYTISATGGVDDAGYYRNSADHTAAVNNDCRVAVLAIDLNAAPCSPKYPAVRLKIKTRKHPQPPGRRMNVLIGAC